ncbi:MAG: SDR family oxidoreductase [Myxococcales bacterium]|nr:SDR family oxidoreductase [Myxococcales bacterium]
MERDLDGRTFVITGANVGIGRATALALAGRGARLILACRSAEKTQPVIDELKAAAGHDEIHFVALDLASLDSVRQCADALVARPEPFDCLINNAGLAGVKGLTKDGFEIAFGVNHLGHFLLTLRLLDKLKAAGKARVVTVASQAHYAAKTFDWEVRKPSAKYTALDAYQRSKVSNVLFTAEAARRWAGTGVTTYALHPGVVASAIWREIPQPFRAISKLFMISNEEGAKTSLYCATEPSLAEVSGRYYDKCQEKTPSRLARDESLAAELWQRSLAWTGLA